MSRRIGKEPPNNGMQRTALRATADAEGVCARHAPPSGDESSLRTWTGRNRNPGATASPRGGVGRKPQGESSARGTRITSGLSTWASRHGTTKPDFLSGRCLGKCGGREEKVMVLTRGDLSLCPQGRSARQRTERGRQKSAEAIVARRAPGEGPNEMSGRGPETRMTDGATEAPV